MSVSNIAESPGHLIRRGLAFFSCLCFVVISLTSLGLAQGERFLVESSVDRSTITVGDPITYTLTITRAESVAVEPPEMGINLGQFEIRDYEVLEPRRTEAGTITESYSYVISIYDVGEFEIPPVTVAYSDGQGETQEVSTQAIRITVNSVKPSEAEDIKDIKPPLEILGTSRIYFWAAGALVLVMCVVAFLYLWRRKKRRAEVEGEELGPPRPAHEIAYEELERIEHLHLQEQGLIKQFYSEVSEVIRRYVGRRYYIITMELTTGELVDSMAEAEVEEQHVVAVQSFLEECDLVKFAKFIPSKEVMYETIPRARTIIDATKETALILPVEKKEQVPQEAASAVETEPLVSDAETRIGDT